MFRECFCDVTLHCVHFIKLLELNYTGRQLHLFGLHTLYDSLVLQVCTPEISSQLVVCCLCRHHPLCTSHSGSSVAEGTSAVTGELDQLFLPTSQPQFPPHTHTHTHTHTIHFHNGDLPKL